MHDVALDRLVEELKVSLFQKCGFLIKSLRDQYRAILLELGVKTAGTYQSITLKLKLQQKFGKHISIINQSSGSGFICASTIPLGDAPEKLRHLELGRHVDEK